MFPKIEQVLTRVAQIVHPRFQQVGLVIDIKRDLAKGRMIVEVLLVLCTGLSSAGQERCASSSHWENWPQCTRDADPTFPRGC